LRSLGGDVSVADDILQRHGVAFLIVAKEVLARTVVLDEGMGIVASIPEQVLAASGLGAGEIERLTTIFSGTREAYAIVLLQGQPGEIRGSVRTRAPVDAVAIARQFGGGHARRAGFRVPRGDIEVLAERAGTVVRDAISSLRGR
jgi:nanoRNase/pAp phosphatase (c-di-AMP/oligoRNAs hydrolase)